VKKPPSYNVSGGPMMVTCHCKTLESSTNPAEKPSIGFRVKSCLKKKKNTRENTSQRLFESCTQNTKKRKKFTLVVSSSISFSPRERERERERRTLTHSRVIKENTTRDRERETKQRDTQRERETSQHLTRLTSELVSQQEHRLVGHCFFLS